MVFEFALNGLFFWLKREISVCSVRITDEDLIAVE